MSRTDRRPLGLSLLTMATVLALGACSSTNNFLQGDRVDYQSATRGPSLEVPPDLAQLRSDPRFQVPDGTASAAELQAQTRSAAVSAPTTVAPRQVGDLRIERAGTQRWLVTPLSAEQLLPELRQFWLDNGFVLTTDDAALGLLETDWAENRANLPQDVIRRSIGRVFGSLYSTGELDRFRTRVERRGDGGTEVYITHRGMVETYTSQDRDRTVWQPRDPDPDLEATFLQRLMVRLGEPQASATRAVAGSAVASTPAATPSARVVQRGEQPVLELDDEFDRAWRRVGLSLDRTGFTVEDRDRSAGTYFVRYVAPGQPGARGEPGFFGRLFRREGSSDARPENYRITVRSEGSVSVVQVLMRDGAAAPAQTAQRIVTVLAADLR